jgi:hypothetical protein
MAKWRYQSRAPRGPTELALVAEGLAAEGSDEALPVIESLRAHQPIEADVALARLRGKQGHALEAADLLARAFEAYRTDPWPYPPTMRRALDLVVALSDGDAAVAERLLEPLSAPFAVRSLDGARRLTLLWIASQLPEPERCAAAWHELEPWPPWDTQSLTARRDCYRRAHDPRLDQARRDADALLACGASPSWISCL